MAARLTGLLCATLLCVGAVAQTQSENDWIRENVFRVLVDSSELKKRGDWQGALAMLRTTLDGALMPYESALVNESLANTFNVTGDYEKAGQHFRIVLDDPTGFDSVALNRLWYGLTTSTHQLGDHEGVVRVVAQWLEHVDEPSANAYKMLAFAHFELGNRTAALEAGERYAAQLREAGEPVPSSTATFLRVLRRPEGEMSDILTSEISGLVSPDTLRLLVRANDMIDRQRHKQAAVLLSNAIAAADLAATDVAALREKLAWALALGRDMEGAREQLRAITQTPGQLPDEMLDQIWIRHAAASYRTQEYAAALESARTWKQRAGAPNAPYFRLAAMSHWRLDDREAALDHGRRYIELAHSEGEEISGSFKALLGDALAAELAHN